MAKREIVWSSNAQREFADVLAYYLERNQSAYYSLKLVDTVESVTSLLSINPNLGLENEDDLSRTFIAGHYSIIYEFDSIKLSILSFWDDRQDPERKLKRKKHRW